jgi:uncharacterized cupin superfamily protein
VQKFNIFVPAFDHSSEREGYSWRGAKVGKAVGGDEIGACLYELADGERTYPYHLHHGNEEWLLVVAGAPTVRTPAGERVLREGDVLCFPRGAAGAHLVTGPGTILLLSERHLPDVVEYPDSGKVGVRTESRPGENFRRADAVGYWYGE